MYPNWTRQLSCLYLWISLCYPDAEQNPTNQSKEARLSLNTRNILKISDELTNHNNAGANKKRSYKSIDRHTHMYKVCCTSSCKTEREKWSSSANFGACVFYVCLCWFACNKKGALKTSTFQFSPFACNANFFSLNIFFLSFIRTLAPSLRQNESDNQKDLWTQLITHYIVTDVHSSFASIAAALCKDQIKKTTSLVNNS